MPGSATWEEPGQSGEGGMGRLGPESFGDFCWNELVRAKQAGFSSAESESRWVLGSRRDSPSYLHLR